MISVIVPVYKVATYLHQCIDSILGQTYRDLEILLIDDGSPDNCGEICEEYAKIDMRIRVFHTENKGVSAARNLGLQEAKGDYIGFVDSDDWIEPDMYEILLRQIKDTGTSISVCGVWNEYLVKKYEKRYNDTVYHGKDAVMEVVCNLCNYVWNKLFRKDIWTGIRFPENCSYEDVATLYKVVLRSDSLSCIQAPLYHYRMREKSIIHTKSMKNIKDYWFAIYNRYTCLCALSEFRNDREIIDLLEKNISSAAASIWLWVCWIPKEQRDYDFLYMVSGFVRENFPSLWLNQDMLANRVALFFSRYTNNIAFAALRTTIRFSSIFKKKSRETRLFPI